MLFHTFFVATLDEQKAVTERRGPQSLPAHASLLFRGDASSATNSLLPPFNTLLPFCFPLQGGRAVTGRRDQEHCFTLTINADGARLHGFCREALGILGPTKIGGGRLRPALHGSAPVLCIISDYLWPSVFFKVLQTVEASLKASPLTVHAVGNGNLPASMPEDWPAADILKQLLSQRLTPSTRSLTLAVPPRGSVPVQDRSGRKEVRVPAALAGLKEYADIHPSRLLWYVTPRQMVSILAAMLMERRVIFMSATEIGKLPLAVHAAAALLHPFSWRHVYLPLVPQALQDYVTAPMPLLAGVWEQVLVEMQAHDDKLLNSALVVDLDVPGRCIPEVGCIDDDAALLPSEPTEKLILRLDRVKELLSSAGDDRCAVEVYHAIADFLTCLIGPWEKCLVSSDAAVNGSSIELDVEALKALQQRRGEDFFVFQESFLHSQMFDHFIQERLRARSSPAQAAVNTQSQVLSLPKKITKTPKKTDEMNRLMGSTKNEESLLDDDSIRNAPGLISIDDPTLAPTPILTPNPKFGMAVPTQGGMVGAKLEQKFDQPKKGGPKVNGAAELREQKESRREAGDGHGLINPSIKKESSIGEEWSLSGGKDDLFRDLVLQATRDLGKQQKP